MEDASLPAMPSPTMHELVDGIWAEAIEGMCSQSLADKELALERIAALCGTICSAEARGTTVRALLTEAIGLLEQE